MNKNLNLVEILKNCPKGIMLYSPMFGQVEFVGIATNSTMPIAVKRQDGVGKEVFYKTLFSAEGKYLEDYHDSECLLFPSKQQRDWSKFEAPIPDKALVWCWDDCDLYQRTLRFYDAKNQVSFSCLKGDRGGMVYDHFELFQGEEPEWAIEARKKLAD